MWGCMILVPEILQFKSSHAKKVNNLWYTALSRECWADALTVCSVFLGRAADLLSVPDWSPAVFVLASLSVWSGCFRNTDWPALRPNASLSSQLYFSFAYLLHRITVSIIVFHTFWIIFNLETLMSLYIYVLCAPVLCYHAYFWDKEMTWPPSCVYCLIAT